MPIQRYNGERDALQTPERTIYQVITEPLGGFGLWNGQFEQGPDGQFPGIEGWEVTLDDGNSVVERYNTQQRAGLYCVCGYNTAANATAGAITSVRYLPVNMQDHYLLSVSMLGSSATAQFDVSVECYTTAKVYISTVDALTAYAPGTSWVDRKVRFGPSGDAAFAANTVYVRVKISLQVNGATLANTASYVDNVWFQPVSPATSASLSLTQAQSYDSGSKSFTLQVFTQHPNTVLTLVAEEPSYIYYAYYWSGRNSAIRQQAIYVEVFVDGVVDSGNLDARIAQSIANYYIPVVLVGRTSQIYGRGSHTIDARIWVVTAGDTYNAYYTHATAYLVRAY